jgi:ABC-type nitrate/sulfonate/bicarbonate transport systems, periplasmic components
MKKTFYSLIYIALFFIMSGNAVAKTLTIELNWFPEVDDGGIYQAIAEGLYKKSGLDVKVIPGGEKPNGQIQLASGKYDFYTGSEMSILRAYKEGLPVEAVAAILQKPLTAIITHDDINSLKQLKGHTILVSATGRFTYWPWLRNKYGLSNSQRRPYLGSVGPFLDDKNIAQQGYITYEPYIIEKHGVKCKTYLLSDHGLPGQGELLETNKDFATKHPLLVKTFVADTIQGYKDYIKNPTLGNKLINSVYPSVSFSTLNYGSYILNKYCIITGKNCSISSVGMLNKEAWKNVYDFMLKWKILDAPTDYMGAYTSKFLPK